jgi:ankyrin repeat protein
MECKAFITYFFTALTDTFSDRFRWVYCQLEHLADCPPVGIRRALDELPATLEETYERTLREIKDTNSEYARRLLLCVAVASRPLRVEELAEILAFDFEAGPIPEFREECRLKNPVAAVLSMCSTLLSLVNVRDYHGFHNFENHQVVQFAHFSVKEFLTSTRFAEKRDSISGHYHISMTPAHTVIAQACLGMLLHLDKHITRDSLTLFPLAKYAAEYWFEHARFQGVAQNVEEGMKQLFDQTKPFLSIWLWIHDPTVPAWQRRKEIASPFPQPGTPLHYAAFCGLHGMAKLLAIGNPKDVNSCRFYGLLTPLHLTSREGHVDVARMLMKHGADVSAQDQYKSTPLHWASSSGHLDVARMLVERGADVSAQARGKNGFTPLHWALKNHHLDMALMLVDCGADVSAQDEDGGSPLHWALKNHHLDVARILVERGADVSAQDKNGWSPLHLTLSKGHLDVARMLIERGADVSARTKSWWTPLHWVARDGHVDLARMLLERGANVSPRAKNGWTPLQFASSNGHVDVAQFLMERGADGGRKYRMKNAL